MIYTWDIASWVERNLGSRKRKTVLMAFIRMHLTPVSTLHTEFLATNADLDDKVKYSSQQLVLQSFLNKKFDATNKQIRIETVSDAWKHPRTYYRSEAGVLPMIFYRSEAETDPLLRYRSEKALNGLFNVYLPSGLSSKEAEIKSWLDYYKEASKTYQIIYI